MHKKLNVLRKQFYYAIMLQTKSLTVITMTPKAASNHQPTNCMKNKRRPHHEFGVSFGQGVSDKPNGLQMVNHCMEEFGLNKKMKETKLTVEMKIVRNGNTLHLK